MNIPRPWNRRLRRVAYALCGRLSRSRASDRSGSSVQRLDCWRRVLSSRPESVPSSEALTSCRQPVLSRSKGSSSVAVMESVRPPIVAVELIGLRWGSRLTAPSFGASISNVLSSRSTLTMMDP